MNKVLLGHCPVDSGQIIFVDPCYADKGFDYDEVCAAHTVMHTPPEDGVERKFGDYTFHNGVGGPALSGLFRAGAAGVVTGTGYGDGVYPVYAYVNDEGRVMKAEIDFS